MVKKIFSRAKVVRGSRWYIDYTTHDTSTGEQKRCRKEFNLNDIHNLEVRGEVAQRLADNIELFAGRVEKEAASSVAIQTTVHAAVSRALAEKQKLPRKNTRNSYQSITNMFLEWCKSANVADMPIADFGKKNARAYWDYYTGLRQYRTATLYNRRTVLGALWEEIRDREETKVNPWPGIKLPPAQDKNRRPFTDVERVAVATEAEQKDYWMFRAILLQFYCYIRPVEITRLKFRDFDLGAGTVTVLSGNAKKWKRRTATIPTAVMHYFQDGRFDKYPGNFFMLGKIDLGERNYRLEPSTDPVGDDRMYKRHKKLLLRLKDKGALQDLAGLTWYSWKDTGISLHTRKTSPVATKDQAGHVSLSVTSLYYHAAEINAEYRKLQNDLTV